LVGKTQGSWGGSTVKTKGTPVLRQRSGNSLSLTEVNFSLALSPKTTFLKIDQFPDSRYRSGGKGALTTIPSKISLQEVKTEAIFFFSYTINSSERQDRESPA
jgi:hypothetical protein